MTDDELDRALRALPLDEPPAGLRQQILAATVLRPPATFRPWEIWLLGTLLALAAWLCVDVVSAGPAAAANGLARISGWVRDSGVTSPTILFWLGIGFSSVWWISHLTLMPQQRIAGTKR